MCARPYPKKVATNTPELSQAGLEILTLQFLAERDPRLRASNRLARDEFVVGNAAAAMSRGLLGWQASVDWACLSAQGLTPRKGSGASARRNVWRKGVKNTTWSGRATHSESARKHPPLARYDQISISTAWPAADRTRCDVSLSAAKSRTGWLRSTFRAFWQGDV